MEDVPSLKRKISRRFRSKQQAAAQTGSSPPPPSSRTPPPVGNLQADDIAATTRKRRILRKWGEVVLRRGGWGWRGIEGQRFGAPVPYSPPPPSLSLGWLAVQCSVQYAARRRPRHILSFSLAFLRAWA
jgi:hypothetical protein